MAITIDSLKFKAAERMTDNADGGGRMSATEIVSGVENSIFDDVSDVDRAAGDCSVRKLYATVASADTDKYLDAGVVIFKAPADPNVRVLATTTGSFYDERADIQEHIETYMVQGPRYAGFLYETQIAGARAMTIFGRIEDEPPGVNTTLKLIEFDTTAQLTESYSQYIRVIRVLLDEIQTFTTSEGTFERRVITVELSDALRYDFHGSKISKFDDLTPKGMIYSCVVADSSRYYGIRPMVLEASSGDLSVYADAIYERIVPTSQVDIPVLDANAAAEKTFAAAASGGTVSFVIGDTFSPNFTLYVGRAILPNSLIITVSDGTLTDDGGDLKSGAASIGTVNYTDGTVVFAGVSPTYSGSKTVSFIPAAPLTRTTNSFGLPVTEATRQRTYVASLKPVPNAGTLVVDYMSAGNWYRLRDDGNGILYGAAESYGAGTLNLSTGSVSITLGALPDLYSSILFTYGSGVDTKVTTGTGAIAFSLSFDLPRLVAGTVSLAWDAITLDTDDGNGNLSGTGGTAIVNYATGAVVVTPTTLPAANTVFTLAGDQYQQAAFYSESFTPTPDVDGVISLTLGHTDIAVGSGCVTLTYLLQADPADPALAALVEDLPGELILNSKAVQVRANGADGWQDGYSGTINHAAGTLTLDTDGAFISHTMPVFVYNPISVNFFDTNSGLWSAQIVPYKVFDRWETVTAIAGIFKAGSTVWVNYSTSLTVAPATATATLSTISFTLTRPSSEFSYVPGSVRIALGARIYTDFNNRMVYGANPATGTATDAGSFDAASGTVSLTDWPEVANTYTQSAGASRQSLVLVSRAVFRTPASPVAVGSFSFRVTVVRNAEYALEGEADNAGVISGAVDAGGVTISCYGKFDYQTGVADVYFGRWVTAANYTTAAWYDETAVRDDGLILYPASVKLDTLLYNCVTYSTLPLDSSIIGLDPVRLPADGRVPVFKDGQLILVHNTQVIAENSLSPTQVIDCGRVRLYRVVIIDANGVVLSPEYYTLDRTLGTVTMKPTLDLTGLTGPYSVAHTVADLSVISDADLSGRLNLTKAVSHTYPADTSYVSGVLYAGTLQARITKLFEQSTWTSVWSDELIGSQPLAQFNDAQYPIQLTNAGAYPDRILIKFTSSTEFQVIGENLGLIGVGDTSTDCSPLNSLTGVAYFTIPYLGWGLGWATGNCLRFNVISAAYPIDLIRAIQPSDPSGLDSDSVELLLLGNIDQ